MPEEAGRHLHVSPLTRFPFAVPGITQTALPLLLLLLPPPLRPQVAAAGAVS